MAQVVAVGIALTLLSVSTAGQQAQPRFAVASVKENLDGGMVTFSETPNGVSYRSVSVAWLISRAFTIQEREIVGGPSWIRTRLFNVDAKSETEMKSRDDVPPMLQALLEGRFGLDARRVQEERPVYAMVVARSDKRLGPSLKPTTSSCSRPEDFPSSSLNFKKGANGQDVLTIGRCGITYGSGRGQFGPQVTVVIASRVTIPQFAAVLTNILDRPVTDRTGLTAEFDFVVQPAKVLSASPSPSGDDGAGNQKLFVAIEDQLGLKLQPTRAPVDVLVIDSVHAPTEN
jgi:uncharacterized protein (TIGR03435 family)